MFYGKRTLRCPTNSYKRSPSQDLPDIVRLAFTNRDLQSITQRDAPPLAAQSRHLTDVVHVNNRIAVNSLKLRCTQPAFDCSQRLSCQKALLGGHDPN